MSDGCEVRTRTANIGIPAYQGFAIAGIRACTTILSERHMQYMRVVCVTSEVGWYTSSLRRSDIFEFVDSLQGRHIVRDHIKRVLVHNADAVRCERRTDLWLP